METPQYNVSSEFHPYGFHRDKGAYPGILLKQKLKKVLEQKNTDRIVIILNDMKTIYGSFIDGAFGEFIDTHKEKFFEHFIFVSDSKPEFISVVNKIYLRHKEKNFNG